jgi:hypothetical protein
VTELNSVMQLVLEGLAKSSNGSDVILCSSEKNHLSRYKE